MSEINNKFKNILKMPMLIVFIIICFMFLPKAINMRSAVFRSAIVVAFGIDFDQNNLYEISTAINVSSTSDTLSENTKLMSAKGTSISDAISNLSTQFGRPIRFGHTKFILIGSNLANQNMAVILDGVIRTNKMRDTVSLVLCEGPIDDMLNVGIEIKNKTGIKMSEIITHQSEYSTTAMDSNVDSFFKGYFSKAGISKINCIKLTDDYNEGITPDAALGELSKGQNSNSANETETSGGFSGDNQKKYLSVTGEIAVFKNGILEKIVPRELSNGAYWINTAYLPKKLSVKNVINKSLNNSDVYFYVLNKSVTREVFIYKNIPMLSAKINLKVGIDEILNHDGSITPLSTDVVDQDLKCEIGREIRKQTAKVLTYGYQNNLDVLELNQIFYLDYYKGYMEYLAKGYTTEDFMKNVQISLEVRVEVI